MKPIIRVENLSKQYRLGRSQAAPYATLRESLEEAVRAPLRRLRRGRSDSNPRGEENFWALKDVSFEVQPGEVVGIIGRNGAGKSTLLKILSRVTEPTSGWIELYGRVGSLLEVGTGFHPELTGRENIFLNGAILGMSRRQILKRFDEIIKFAEIEAFLDTPVKHYSSGMYTRLAFAVAAHLEPEILVVDEVLAVGDQAFQKKCLGKISEAASGGRTVLFVSHNLVAVDALCDRCLLVRKGQIVADGHTQDVISTYVSIDSVSGSNSRILGAAQNGRRSERAVMTKVSLYDNQRKLCHSIQVGQGIEIEVEFVSQKGIQPVLGVMIKNQYGAAVTGINNRIIPGFAFNGYTHSASLSLIYDSLLLAPGHYTVDLFFGDPVLDHDVAKDAIGFEVVSCDIFGSGKLPPPTAGSYIVPATWQLRSPSV